LANDGPPPGSTKFVDALTFTVYVMVAIQVVTVKEPVAPAVPHVPVALEPFTDATVPNTPRGIGVTGGATNTLVAVTVVPETEPTAPAISPTQTLANDGLLTPGSTKVVVDPTLTVKPEEILQLLSVKEPAAPAVPHVPVAVEPFTDVTVPNAP
jgi:hypothetical protein